MSDNLVGRTADRWLFGKIPSLGDFVSRGLSSAQSDRLDGWLAGQMQAARVRFGEEFEVRFDSAPPWNFVDRDDDGSWQGGAMCASQDRVGRRFPLIMAARAADAGDAVQRSASCLAAIYRGFAEGWDADAFQIADIPGDPSGWQPESSEWALLAEGGPAMVIAGRYPAEAVATMVELAL